MELGPEGRADRCIQLTFLEERSRQDRPSEQKYEEGAVKNSRFFWL